LVGFFGEGEVVGVDVEVLVVEVEI